MAEDHKKEKKHKKVHASDEGPGMHKKHKKVHDSDEGPGKHKKHKRKSVFSQQYFPAASDNVYSSGVTTPFVEYAPLPSVTSNAGTTGGTTTNSGSGATGGSGETGGSGATGGSGKTVGGALTAAGLGAASGAMFGPVGAVIGGALGLGGYYADEIAKGIDEGVTKIDTAVKNDPGIKERVKRDTEYQKAAGVTDENQLVTWGGM